MTKVKSTSIPWKNWRIWTAIALVIAIFVSLTTAGSISLTEVYASLTAFPLWALFSALLLATAQVILMGARLWTLAPRPTPFLTVVWAVAYGQFANAFFPARAGDALKIAILSDSKKGAGLSFTAATGILVADRPVDISALLLWIGISGSHQVAAFQSEKFPSIGTVLLYFIFGILLVVLFFKSPVINKFPKFRERISEFGKSAGVFLNFRHGLPALAFGLSTWLCEFIILLVLVHSIGFQLSFAEIVGVIVILNLAIAIPISVANVGPFEAAMAYALTKLGLPAATALSVAILHHAFQVLGTCVATLTLATFQKLSKT